MIKKSNRPVFLNLFQIKLPIAGMMSIAHRLAGLFLLFSLPFWLYILELSLSSQQAFDQAAHLLRSILLWPFYLILLWAMFHHLLAGIRYLLLDVDIGIEKPIFQKTARTVLWAAPLIVILLLMVIL